MIAVSGARRPLARGLPARAPSRDRRPARAGDRATHGVTQVIEVAAGLSPRGWRFTAALRRPAHLRRGRPAGDGCAQARALEQMGSLTDRHRVAEVDALRDDGPGSLAALAAELDRGCGARDHHRGLLGYLAGRRGRRDLAPLRATLPGSPAAATSPTCTWPPSRTRRSGSSGCCCRRSCAGACTCTSTTPQARGGAAARAGLRRPSCTARATSGAGDRGRPRRTLAHILEASTHGDLGSRSTTIPPARGRTPSVPALRVLEWRYGDQLDWRLVLIGLTEDAPRSTSSAATRPLRGALGQLRFRRYGMPFSPSAEAAAQRDRARVPRGRRRAAAASRAANGSRSARSSSRTSRRRSCSTTTSDLAACCGACPGSTPTRIVSMLDAPEVTEAYERDRAEARERRRLARPSCRARPPRPTARCASPPRRSCSSRDGTRLVAGGFQPVEAYDVLIANLDPTLHREPRAGVAGPLLERFREGLTTQEVAALLAAATTPPTRSRRAALIELVAAGEAVRRPRRRRAVAAPEARRRWGGGVGVSVRLPRAGSRPSRARGGPSRTLARQAAPDWRLAGDHASARA